MASVIEQSQVAPPPSTSVAELTLPLTYFDLYWLPFHRMRRILFYKHPISRSTFVQTAIPNLKHSLSLTLKHYMPLAGNVVCPLNSSGYPELRFITGDTVLVTFSESDMDFSFLVGNHPRNAKDFYHLVPQLAEAKNEPGVQLAPLLGIQVTLFPDQGISIAFTNHHVAGDGASIVRFIRAWALLNKFNGNQQFLEEEELVPCYDRSAIRDPYGQGMSSWHTMKETKLEMSDIVTPPDNKVRSTFIVGRDDIVKLKTLVLSRRPSLAHVTSFTVACGYVWTCLIKSEAAIGEEIGDDVMEFFLFAADCRARVNPPLPQSYFGNCIVAYFTKTRHSDLAGNNGFTTAVELIGEAIQNRIKDEEWILRGDWSNDLNTIDWSRSTSVAGSPKLDLYGADFGWGRAEKVEFVSIDSGDGVAMSLSTSKDSDGDIEVGLSLPENRMNAFAAIFAHGLSFL